MKINIDDISQTLIFYYNERLLDVGCNIGNTSVGVALLTRLNSNLNHELA